MYCKYCGAQIQDQDTPICQKCGGEFSSHPESSFSTWFQQKKTQIIESSRPKIDKARINVSENLDKLIGKVKDSDLAPKYRERLAQSLASLKTKIQLTEVDESNRYESSEVDTERERLLSEELLNQLKSDRCIICYSGFNDQNDILVLICPECGQGGHKEHLDSYIISTGTCPVCRKKVPIKKWFEMKIV